MTSDIYKVHCSCSGGYLEKLRRETDSFYDATRSKKRGSSKPSGRPGEFQGALLPLGSQWLSPSPSEARCWVSVHRAACGCFGHASKNQIIRTISMILYNVYYSILIDIFCSP